VPPESGPRSTLRIRPSVLPGQIGTDTDWISVSCGWQYSLAFKRDGSVWACGLNEHGQLGIGMAADSVVPVRVVSLDASGPVTVALPPVTARNGKTAAFRPRVDDLSSTATVTIRIFKGSTVKRTLKLGSRATNVKIVYTWKCTLATGSYVWKVLATDAAGNAQQSVGRAKLTVT